MANVFDVASYILGKRGEMTAMKLQKLTYYSQAWHLVWAEVPLFDNEIEAWANGPVCRDLYVEHAGKFRIGPGHFASRESEEGLSDSEKANIDKVLEFYGERSAIWLSDLTHKEQPWLGARGDLRSGEPGQDIITQSAMSEYYGGL